jgi:hypothetical protein
MPGVIRGGTVGLGGIVGLGGRTILRGNEGGFAGSDDGSGSEGTTAVRVDSVGLAEGEDLRAGSTSSLGRAVEGVGVGSGAGAFSTILIRESALFWGRKAFVSASRTINCLGAWVLPCRIARTVDSSRAASWLLTSTPIDCSRKRTSLLPMPIWAASSSTRIFPIRLG